MTNSDLVIIKYNAGNIMSVIYALERIGVSYEFSDDAEKILNAKRVIFPGVGHAKSAMQSLVDKGLDKIIPTLTQPFLGTCVGMQLLCRSSEESDTPCLGVFDVPVLKFSKDTHLKVPQTGWNNIYNLQSDLCNGIEEQSYVYYNHAYYVPNCEYTIANTDYSLEYSAILRKNNFYACQFHSEISGNVGQKILENFVKL